MTKSKIDLSKGFKRIYYILVSLWFIYIWVWGWFQNFMWCRIHGNEKGAGILDECHQYSAMYEFTWAIILSALAIPVYLFLKWIAKGFVKK